MRTPGRLLISLTLFLLATQFSLARQQKPRVALVLSGGGSRGAAHIGVLKVLEREKIPIDVIVGTSFGALVGGLYSLGYDTGAIEQLFANEDWTGVFSNAPDISLSPLLGSSTGRYQGELNLRKYRFELPSGLLVGQRLIEILDLLTTERIVAAGFDFDRLAYRFRAVATDLVSGDRYVFKDGSMTEAIRSAVAIPLLFTPVEKDKMLLVDGGLVDNLPTDVAREMQADIVIAVDVTSPLLEKDQIKTFVQVMDQSISLLMRRNVEANRKLADLVLQPELQEYPGTEYTRISEIVRRGAEVAERQLPQIRALVANVPPHGPQPLAPLAPVPAIVSLSFEGLKEVPSSQLRPMLTAQIGEPLNVEKLERDLRRLYASGLFERVDFKLIPAGPNGMSVVYLVQETAMRTLGAALRYDQDYGFVGLAEFRARQLFHTPSLFTISTQFGGLEEYVGSLHLVPAHRSFVYVSPEIHYSNREYPEFQGDEVFDHYKYQRWGGQLMLGTFFKRSEIEVGYRTDRASIIGGTAPFTQAGSLQMRGLRLSVVRNTTDGHRLPNRGTMLFARADVRDRAFGSGVDFTRAEMDLMHFFPLTMKSNLQLSGAAGFSHGNMPFYERFYVGGFNFSEGGPRRLVGYQFAELAARQMVIASAAYRYRWFFQPLGFVKRAFVSGIYNAAAVSDSNTHPYDFQAFHGFGAELAFDTLVGPMRVAAGWGTKSRFNFYLSLGPSF